MPPVDFVPVADSNEYEKVIQKAEVRRMRTFWGRHGQNAIHCSCSGCVPVADSNEYEKVIQKAEVRAAAMLFSQPFASCNEHGSAWAGWQEQQLGSAACTNGHDCSSSNISRFVTKLLHVYMNTLPGLHHQPLCEQAAP